MGLFQHSVLNKYLKEANQDEMQAAWEKLVVYFQNPVIQQNITRLTLSEEAEWMHYFNEQKQKAQALKSEVDQTDREIDRLVYELYDLTEEEIGESVNKKEIFER
jgi:hypothetical protein